MTKAMTVAQALVEYQRGAKIGDLTGPTGFKRSKLRRLLVAAAGGKAAITRPTRAAGERARPTVSDEGVKIFRQGALASKGWTTRREWVGRVVRIKAKGDDDGRVMHWRECKALIFVSPKGREYVRALDTEPADLIMSYKHYGKVRLRRYAHSRVAREVAHEAVQAERGQAAVERVRGRKRAARKSRAAARGRSSHT
jgi:predicted PP-loop superfamily ATPase